MSSRSSVSVSTVVALALALLTAAAVATAVVGSSPEASAHDEPTTDEPAEGGELAEGDDSERNLASGGTAETQAALADHETATLSGQVGVRNDGPVAGAIASTRPVVAGECPVMTDSIRRIYLALLEREPTSFEFEREIDRYRTGEANLEDLAGALAAGGLFRTRYGPLGDEAFVERVYANTLDREPSPAVVEHWTTILADGYPRGSVALALSESAEFVRRTDTSRPLSGYLTWYPSGTHWYCGVGAADDLAIRPLTGDALYADYMFTNEGEQGTATGLATVLDGRQLVEMSAGTLPEGFSDYRWDGRFVGDGPYGEAIDVVASNRTSWVVVFYPRRLGQQRLGWQLQR